MPRKFLKTLNNYLGATKMLRYKINNKNIVGLNERELNELMKILNYWIGLGESVKKLVSSDELRGEEKEWKSLN